VDGVNSRELETEEKKAWELKFPAKIHPYIPCHRYEHRFRFDLGSRLSFLFFLVGSTISSWDPAFEAP